MQLQFPVMTKVPAALAAGITSPMIAPPPIVACFLSFVNVIAFNPAILMRTPVLPRLNVLAHPLPPFWVRNGIRFCVQYLTCVLLISRVIFLHSGVFTYNRSNILFRGHIDNDRGSWSIVGTPSQSKLNIDLRRWRDNLVKIGHDRALSQVS
jgi:hypothetical protein